MADRADYVNQFNCHRIVQQSTNKAVAGETGRHASFETIVNVRVGAWFNAAKAYMQFGTGGSTEGMASAFNVEMDLPDQDIQILGGVYCALEVNLNFQTNTILHENVNFPICMAHFKAGGTQAKIDTWEDAANAGVFSFQGLTANDASVFALNAGATIKGTLKIIIGAIPYYLLLATSPTS